IKITDFSEIRPIFASCEIFEDIQFCGKTESYCSKNNRTTFQITQLFVDKQYSINLCGIVCVFILCRKGTECV
ncbi:MAG TPA: hypothetical protein PLJ38_03220, partial [bacterium]|nr:hypothetical protein [bacterium]